ncbi:MAG TPA: hypothetical protein VFV89_00615 [Nocardioides sp.]|uniref:hypothetical protein n=1 Tax=Nocardioides sp. TaxID=35761 RepID=UPI002E364542|nr:hypothetical protein [Nocardioides sp.]HEX5086280.1 hypothetical protein [Nocardioides sp.]
MSGAETPGQPTDASEEELARLRAEVARLKEQQAPAEPRDRAGWWRPVVAGVLVLVAAVLAPLSVLATWANGQINDTDRYLETVGPLANDPDIQKAVAARVEQVIFSYLDIDAATEALVEAINQQGLPPAAAATLQAAVGPLASGIRSFVNDKVVEFVQSDNFADAWVRANREAHSQLVAALTGNGDAVTVEDGQVTIGLATIIDAVKAQLVDAGFALAERIPEVDATFTILQSADLGKVQRLLGLIDNLSTWLPVIALGLVAIAVVIARDRRRMVLAAGVAIAVSMVVLGAALNAIRPFYLDALPADSSTAAAGALYDQVVSFIRYALRGVLVVGLAVAVGAWLSSPRGSGATARAGLTRGIDLVRHGGARAGMNTGRFGVFLRQYRTAIRVVTVAVAALWYLSLDHPTGNTALWFVVVVAVVLLLTELLAAGPPGDGSASDTPADAGETAT